MMNNKVSLTIADCQKEGLNQVKKSFQKAQKLNSQFNMFSKIYKQEQDYKNQGLLKNIPFIIKDNYDHFNKITHSSSKTIKNHLSGQNSWVVEKLLEQGAIPIAKSNCDEFGMGGTGLSSFNGPVINPIDETKLIHGSSSGSAAAVALGIVPFALGTDTGDSSRKPAAAVGIFGFKPTWGLISRRGIHSFSPAFDTVGFMTNSIKDIALLLDVTTGFDDKDFTSADVKKINYSQILNEKIKVKKIAYFKESMEIFEKKYHPHFFEVKKKLEERGIVVEEVEFGQELLKVLYPTYQAITFADITSELAKITGIPFGQRIDLNDYKNNVKILRTKNFGKIVKQRILIGGYIISKENYNDVYIKAKKVRRLFINRINEIFEKYDLVFSLGSKIPNNKISDGNTSLKLDDLMQIANMGGNPSLIIPSRKKIENNFFGFEVMGPIFKDGEVLQLGSLINEILKEGE